jgi:hypothetical protein
MKKHWTLYGVIGESFAWVCLGFSSIYIVLAFLKASLLDKLFAMMPFLGMIRIDGRELHQRLSHAQPHTFHPVDGKAKEA